MYPLVFAAPVLRLYAMIVDISVLLLAAAVLNLLTHGNFASSEAAPQDIAVFFGYFVILTGFFGQTPGKYAAGIIVVNGDGMTPGVPAAIPREMAGKFLAIALAGIGIAWLVFDQKNQGLHDKLAGTYVVRKGNSGVPGILGKLFRRDDRPGPDA